MRSLFRLLVASLALTLLAVMVLMTFVDSENVLSLNETIKKNHWRFTGLRLIAFALLLGGMYGFRRWKIASNPGPDLAMVRSDSKAQLIRIGLWFVVVELLLGQGLVGRIFELVTP